MDSLLDHPITQRIRERVRRELHSMGTTLNQSLNSYPLREIFETVEASLSQIAILLNRKEINPYGEIRTSGWDSEKKVVHRTLRIGFYPVSANPFHWAHLLIGLSAIAKFKLDKVFYIIAGSDPRKPALAPVEIRHLMGKEVLKIFTPLLGYSSIAAGSCSDGETNIFKILQLNPRQKIDAFYIAGGDHYYRFNPKTGGPDTIRKLEENIANKHHEFNEHLHSVSTIFIERGRKESVVETTLNIHFLPAMRFEASSTMVREAFQGKREQQTLAILPYTAYRLVKAFGLYSSNAYPHEESKKQALNEGYLPHISCREEINAVYGT